MCHEQGLKHLCDGTICEYDGHCKSGCCTQVISQNYKRCIPLLVGDYCARALDPIFLVQQKVEEEELELIKALPEASKKAELPQFTGGDPESLLKPVEPTELPCNVFGTVDRCDGMACEHDGNCYSGCCALFVSGDQKRCMPLVGGDLCPIAIDVVETFQIVDEGNYHEEGFRAIDKPSEEEQIDRQTEYQDEPKQVYYEEEQQENQEAPIQQKKTHEYPPIIEKGEHRFIQDVDHQSPEKSEHNLGFIDMPSYSEHAPIEVAPLPPVQELPPLSTDQPVRHEQVKPAQPIKEPSFDDFDFDD